MAFKTSFSNVCMVGCRMYSLPPPGSPALGGLPHTENILSQKTRRVLPAGAEAAPDVVEALALVLAQVLYKLLSLKGIPASHSEIREMV